MACFGPFVGGTPNLIRIVGMRAYYYYVQLVSLLYLLTDDCRTQASHDKYQDNGF
jgi:hypothetical protein